MLVKFDCFRKKRELILAELYSLCFFPNHFAFLVVLTRKSLFLHHFHCLCQRPRILTNFFRSDYSMSLIVKLRVHCLHHCLQTNLALILHALNCLLPHSFTRMILCVQVCYHGFRVPPFDNLIYRLSQAISRQLFQIHLHFH